MSSVAYVGGHILTMDEAATEHPAGVVIVEDDRITAVGAVGAIGVPPRAEVIDCAGCFVLPGFVNAHSHASQILLRGGPNHSRGLYDWLLNVVIPGLAAYEPGDLRTAIELYTYESVLAGVTTVVANEEPLGVDPEASAREVLDAFAQSGLRTRYAYMFRDRAPEAVGREKGVRTSSDLPAHEALDAVLELICRLSGEYSASTNRLVDVWPSPATTAVVSDESLRKVADLAERIDGRWALHLAETALEGQLRDHSPVEHLARLGLLGPRLLAAHCVHVDNDDIHKLSESGAGVVTNPVSNCFLASGVAPVPAMLRAGTLVAFGTDDANVNDSINPLSDLKVAALLHRVATNDAAAISPEELLRSATVDGARAIGLTDVGALAPDMQADLQVVSARQPHLVPSHDPYATLVFQTLGHEVRDVMVAGRQLMRNRWLSSGATVDELLTRAQEASTRILATAGITPRRERGDKENR